MVKEMNNEKSFGFSGVFLKLVDASMDSGDG